MGKIGFLSTHVHNKEGDLEMTGGTLVMLEEGQKIIRNAILPAGRTHIHVDVVVDDIGRLVRSKSIASVYQEKAEPK